MNTMTIGCALTTYNSNAYLEQQLETLVNQLRPFDEVIIVDDASTNDTVQRLNRFIADHQLENWKVFQHEQNQGFIQTFQDALFHSSSDLIFLCDHDDLWYPQKTKVMTEQFVLQPQLQVLACSFDLVDAKGEQIQDELMNNRANHNLIHRSVNPGQLNEMFVQDILRYNFAPGCTIALKKEIAQEYLDLIHQQAQMANQEENNILSLPHDWAISILGAVHGGLYYLDQPLMGYRQHEHNTLGMTRRHDYTDRLKAAKLEAKQKQALAYIMDQKGSAQQKAQTQQVKDLYVKRANALENKNLFSLTWMLLTTWPQGMFLTFGLDLKTTLFSFVGR